LQINPQGWPSLGCQTPSATFSGSGLARNRICFSGRPLRSLEIRKRYRAKFSRQTQNFEEDSFKGLSPSTTPFGKRKFIEANLIISSVTGLSIQKRDCEKYLLRITAGIWYGNVASQLDEEEVLDIPLCLLVLQSCPNKSQISF
jgi:hypothetical protein